MKSLLLASLTATIAALPLLAPAAAQAGPAKLRDSGRMVAPALEKYTRTTLVGDVWKRGGLGLRDRSIVTLTALITRNQTIELAHYLNVALDKGVKAAENSEIITPLAYYAGRTNGMPATAVAKAVCADRKTALKHVPAASPSLLALDEAAEADRARRVGALFGAAFPGVVQ